MRRTLMVSVVAAVALVVFGVGGTSRPPQLRRPARGRASQKALSTLALV